MFLTNRPLYATIRIDIGIHNPTPFLSWASATGEGDDQVMRRPFFPLNGG